MKKLLFLLVLVLFLSCESNEGKAQQQTSTIRIFGGSDDPLALESLNILNPSYFYTTNHKNETVETFQDSISVVLEEVQTPHILWIAAFGEKAYYSTRIFIEKDEDIHFQIRNGRFEFLGKRAAQHTFFSELDPTDAVWAKLKFKNYTGDIERYKEECDSLYAQRVDFLNAYVRKNTSVSQEFIETVQNELKFEYLRNLISPRFEVSSVSGKYYINTAQDLADLLANSERDEGTFFDLDTYVNKVSLEEFNDPKLLNSDYYKMSLVPFLRQYFVKSKENPYSKAAFMEEVQYINKNLHPKIAEFAIGKLAVDYYHNGMGKDKNSRTYFTNFLRNFQETLGDSTNIIAMNDIYSELEAMDAIVPEYLRQPLITTKKDTIKMPPFLQQKKLKVLNFWASWCEPCIREFQESQVIREQLAERYNVEFVYLSLDANQQKWLKASDRFKDILKEQNYWLFNPRKSTLIRTLQIKSNYGVSIPRYVILDAQNRVIDNNAPAPSSSEFEVLLNEVK